MERTLERKYDEGVYAFEALKDEINRLEQELYDLQDRYNTLEEEIEEIYQKGYNEGKNSKD
jgi:predicted  nucleic acid-binding Zn-ribbon protein